MRRVIYDAPAVWALFQSQMDRLMSTFELIAEYPEFGILIYLTAEEKSSRIFPEIAVYLDDDELYSEVAVSQNDCEQTVKKLYYEYLDEERIVNMLTGDDDEVTEDELDMIQTREDDLDDVTIGIVEAFIDQRCNFLSNDEREELVNDMKDFISEYLYLRWKLPVYRPMVLEDEDGEEFFEEFPYEYMEIDDATVKFFEDK